MIWKMKRILVTGGAGYIGSNVLVELAKKNKVLTVFDNLSNSSLNSLNKVSELIGSEIDFIKGDIRSESDLAHLFLRRKFDGVVHMAGLKAVESSISDPLHYYENNVIGTLNLLKQMKKNNVCSIVFSSSATVYGTPKNLPISEGCKLNATTNPYGTSKLMVEQILRDLWKSESSWNIIILRYFNPLGAHPSGFLGENPPKKPFNIMPLIIEAANNPATPLKIFGSDYNTIDGTGVRDYIHVVDIAKGHVGAVQYLQKKNELEVINLGSGIGFTVRQLINAFEKVNGVKVPFEIVNRRSGDVAACYADISYAKQVLNWRPELSLENMCKDAWLASRNI